ncbi:hypothetical protein LguiA_010040 [Lonicera macranthoides]
MRIRFKTRKLKVIVEDDGSILGEYSKVWKARTKALLRAHIPVSYTDWRQVPKSLKDDVWNALMGEFELNIPLDVARSLITKSWSQSFRSFKTKLQSRLKNDDARGGIDPHTWRKFVENESDPKKQHQNVQNAENRKSLGSFRCYSRHSSAKQHVHQSVQNAENQKNLDSSHCFGPKKHIMQQDHPQRPAGRVDELLVVPGRIDQSVLEIARLAYDEVMAAENGRKSTSLSGEGCSETCRDLNGDELTEVHRNDTMGQVCAVVGSHISEEQQVQVGVDELTEVHRNDTMGHTCAVVDSHISEEQQFQVRVDDLIKVYRNDTMGRICAVGGSHISEEQQVQVGMANTTIEQNKKANEKAPLMKDEIISHVNSRLDNFENIMLVLLSKLSNVKKIAPAAETSPVRELGSSSGPSHLSHSVFGTMVASHPPTPTHTDKPLVILLDKFGKQLAKGYVVTDAIAGVCHFKKVGIGEKKVYVEEVIEPDAHLWDPPQGGHDTLAGYVQGGFLIWLEYWLKYI